MNWISVSDRLPPHNVDVLVYRPRMVNKILVTHYDSYYEEDDGEWHEGWARYAYSLDGDFVITHWAYLPEPPKEEV